MRVPPIVSNAHLGSCIERAGAPQLSAHEAKAKAKANANAGAVVVGRDAGPGRPCAVATVHAAIERADESGGHPQILITTTCREVSIVSTWC